MVDTEIDKPAVTKIFNLSLNTVGDALYLTEQWDVLPLSYPGCYDTKTLKPVGLYNRSPIFPQSVTNRIIDCVEQLRFHDPCTLTAKWNWYDPRLKTKRTHEERWTSMHKMSFRGVY